MEIIRVDKVQRIRTACPEHCGIDCCGVSACVKDGDIVKLEPADFPNEKDKRICLRGLLSLEKLYHPDRLKYPMKRIGERGKGKFKRISWEEAYDIIVENFKEISDEYGWKSIGWVLGGPGAGTTKLGAYLRLASLTQSTRVSSWGYGDAGLPCGSRVIFGRHIPNYHLYGEFWQRKWPDLLVIWGANPGETEPLQSMRKVLDAKENGSQIVTIDPRFTVTASKADQHLSIKPGTDSALALGLLYIIFRENLHDIQFIRRHTNGPYLVRTDNGKFLEEDVGEGENGNYMIWDEKSGSARPVNQSNLESASITGSYTIEGTECKPAFQLLTELVHDYSPERVAKISGISKELIIKLAKKIGSEDKVTFFTFMGFTRTYHGDLSFRGLATVASVTGNVNTSFSSGHYPAELNWDPFINAGPDKSSYHRIGILNLYEAVIEGEPFPIKAVWFAFINFLNQCANSDKIIREFFPKLDFIVQTDLFMTSTAEYADVVLPVCTFLEFSDLLPYPYPYIQLQQKIIDPLYESRSDVDIVKGLAERLGYGEYFERGEEGFIDLILDHPNLKDYSRNKLKKGAMYLNEIPEDSEYSLDFRTPSGKIEIYAEQLVEDGQALPVYLEPIESPVSTGEHKYPLALISGHSRYRTHSRDAHLNSLLNLNQNPEPTVEINPKDAEERGINTADVVSVFNDRAETKLKAVVTKSVRPGTVHLAEGWRIDQFKEGSLNHLTHDTINPVQDKIYEPNMHMNDVAVEIRKVAEDKK